jgi:hypothetical protein
MREIRLYGSEGGGAVRSPYPYQSMDLHQREGAGSLKNVQSPKNFELAKAKPKSSTSAEHCKPEFLPATGNLSRRAR